MVANLEFSILAVIIISLISMIGLTTLALKRDLLDILIKYMIAFATGSLLAVVFFDLLPEIIEINNGEFTSFIGWLIILSIAISYALEKILHWHHHHSVSHPNQHQSGFFPPYAKDNSESGYKPYIYNILIGDGIHNFVDGIAIVVAFNISIEIGTTIFVGIFIHELAQEYGDFGLLVYGGLSPKKALVANFGSGLMAIIGAFIGVLFLNNEAFINEISVIVLSVTAGLFIYLSIADLIPELLAEYSVSKSINHFLVAGFGVIIIFLITLL